MSLLLASAVLAAFASDHTLVPSGKWTIEYADAQCTLSRPFGDKANRVTLAIGGMPGGQMLQIAVIEQSRPIGDSRPTRLTLSAPGGITFSDRNAFGGGAAGLARVTRGIVPRAHVETLVPAQAIDVGIDGRKVNLDSPQLPAAIKALATCEADLARQWGIDPDHLALVMTPPTPAGAPQTWLTDDDYPAGALRRREQGVVAFRLDVDATGNVSNCAIVGSSGSPELDEKVCKILPQRARFNPGRDAEGHAHPSMYVSRFTWRLPR